MVDVEYCLHHGTKHDEFIQLGFHRRLFFLLVAWTRVVPETTANHEIVVEDFSYLHPVCYHLQTVVAGQC